MFSFYFTWIDLYYTHTHTQIVFAALKKSLVNSSYCFVDCLRLLFLTAYCLCKSSSAVFCVFLRAVCQTGAAGAVGSDVSCSQPTPCVAAEVLGDTRWLWLRPEENNRFRKQPTISAVLPRRERKKKKQTTLKVALSITLKEMTAWTWICVWVASFVTIL